MVRSSQAYLKRDNLSNIIWCTQKQIWRCTSRCVPIGTRSVLDDSRVHAHIPCVWSLHLERSNRRQSRVLFLSPTGVFFFFWFWLYWWIFLDDLRLLQFSTASDSLEIMLRFLSSTIEPESQPSQFISQLLFSPMIFPTFLYLPPQLRPRLLNTNSTRHNPIIVP